MLCVKKKKENPNKLPPKPTMVIKIARKCKICYGAYDYEDHFPMMLGGCGHTFCKECTKPLDKCPLCKLRIESDALIKNYEVLELEEEEQEELKLNRIVMDAPRQKSE